MDYGHDLLFGTFLTPVAAQAERVVALAELTEQVGLDLVCVQDHPYQASYLDAWTLLCVIAARTSTVRVVPNVLNLPLRPPGVLAGSVASLDLLSNGRVELGLGAGGFLTAVAALGGPTLTAGQTVDALAEGIAVLRALWSAGAGTVRFTGEHYRVVGAHPGPAPAHDVGIWVGAYKPRMLALTGRLADGWLPSSPYAPPDQLTAMNAAIDEAALAAGRQPGDVRRVYNVTGSFATRGTGFLAGPASMWAEQLAELALTEGISGFVAMGDDPDDIRRFAAEVAPAVRELVDAERYAPEPVADRPAPDAAPEVHGPAVAVRGSRLGVVPTPDDGTRLAATAVWDEADRPTGPAPDPTRRYTAHEEAVGQHLVDVHDHLRGELDRLRDLIGQVAAGALGAGAARSQIATMTLRQNAWTVGTYCAQYCRLVTMHHSLEDAGVFPHLRRADPALAPVLDRLQAEHHGIHDVLEGVDRALVAFVASPEATRTLQVAVDLLTDTLLSHLSYEERELVEPLARLGFS